VCAPCGVCTCNTKRKCTDRETTRDPEKLDCIDQHVVYGRAKILLITSIGTGIQVRSACTCLLKHKIFVLQISPSLSTQLLPVRKLVPVRDCLFAPAASHTSDAAPVLRRSTLIAGREMAGRRPTARTTPPVLTANVNGPGTNPETCARHKTRRVIQFSKPRNMCKAKVILLLMCRSGKLFWLSKDCFPVFQMLWRVLLLLGALSGVVPSLPKADHTLPDHGPSTAGKPLLISTV